MKELNEEVSRCSLKIFGKDHSSRFQISKLISEGMCPILSMCTSDMYADLVIPTHEDWARVDFHRRLTVTNTPMLVIKKTMKTTFLKNNISTSM